MGDNVQFLLAAKLEAADSRTWAHTKSMGRWSKRRRIPKECQASDPKPSEELAVQSHEQSAQREVLTALEEP